MFNIAFANISNHVVNLVDSVVMVKFRGSELYLEVAAIPERNYESADVKTEIRMVRVLQDLCLLTWLLRQENHRAFQR